MAPASRPGSQRHGKTWAFLLVLVCNFSFVSSVTTPEPPLTFCVGSSRRLTVPQRATHQNLKKLTSHVLPPIPPQGEENVGIHKQFRPRFVAQEFVLGVWTMCLVYPFLKMAGTLMDFVRHGILQYIMPGAGHVALGQTSVASQHMTEIHMLDALTQICVSQFLHIPLCCPTMLVLLGPLVEEIAYRGIGHWVGALMSQVNLWWFVTCCRFGSPALAIGMDAMIVVVSIMNTMASDMKSPELILVQAFNVVTTLILLRPKLAIKSSLKRSKLSGAPTPVQTCPETGADCKGGDTLAPSRIGPLNHSRFISRLVSSKNGTLSPELELSADLAVRRSARWYGSSMFGLAHFGMVPIHGTNNGATTRQLYLMNTWYFQKLVGTIVSSLLVEGRLVLQRRTLWGSIGAHIAYNAMSLLSRLALLIYPVVALVRYQTLKGPFLNFLKRATSIRTEHTQCSNGQDIAFGGHLSCGA